MFISISEVIEIKFQWLECSNYWQQIAHNIIFDNFGVKCVATCNILMHSVKANNVYYFFKYVEFVVNVYVIWKLIIKLCLTNWHS